MKTKENLFFLALICLTFVCICAAVRTYHVNLDLKKQVNDLNVELAHSKITLLKDNIRDSIPVVTQRVIEVDKTDYKQQLADKQLIKDLGLKVDQLVSENKMLRETRDTVFLKPDNDSVLSYHDKWADFEYWANQQLLKYAVRDSFDTFINRIYKHKFLWWKWGTKGYQVKHVNFNPNVDVKYNQFILIKE